ncbi:MAG: hypothetical protein P0116_08130 [Candidatus Nitrosocosmicus sp.]|nr:hypothetical protein [Candidatus Nitrosocosmicus sp.]
MFLSSSSVTIHLTVTLESVLMSSVAREILGGNISPKLNIPFDIDKPSELS